MLTRTSIAVVLILGAVGPSCRIPERDSLILMPDKGGSESVVVTTFIDVVKAHYATRKDGVLSVPRKDGRTTQLDFTYVKKSAEGYRGERIILNRGEVIQSQDDEESTLTRSGYIHTYRVEATYLLKGVDTHVEGLAKLITERVQEGISEDSYELTTPGS